MAAAWTGTARILRRHCYQPAALPSQLIVQLPPELEPSLIKDGLVQARLGPNILARLPGCACRRLGQVPYLQVLDTHHRVVLADRGRGLVQVVAAGITDAGVDTLEAGFRLLPVAAELDLAAQCLLCLAQSHLVPLEAIERRIERAVRERGKPGNAHVDADCTAIWDRLLDLALGLDRHEPLATRLADSDVLHRTQHFTAEANPHSAELGQEEAIIMLFQPDLFRVGIAEAVVLAFLLEAREVGPLGEKVGVGLNGGACRAPGQSRK